MLRKKTKKTKTKKLINKVTYRNDHISLLRDSMLPNVLNFAFIYFIVTEKKKITLKEK